MSIRYPNGKKFEKKRIFSGQKNVNNKDDRFSNRGMSLEEDINETNDYYRAHQIAVIHKKPTPLQIVKVNYPKRSAAVVTEAYFKKPSTTDYNGVFQGRYIDFEAKETRNKTSFPLKNFHEHQIQHMKEVMQHNGIAFALLKFSLLDEVYLLEAHELMSFYDKQDTNRKSIPKKEIEERGHLIPFGYHPRIDYLKIIDKMIDRC
ncbi:Holliday junction resolvase RecU [Salipaludibacillus agaradhaerens]|uniref:Holliday junction resolvase RecU n=1 Tax=Salipaludibacillus agaradhaerens TaxID=76935 RepID=UPI000997961B|nr:Holliday junction resolvase RecU [Salipaludibacillus agaradhaerens]MCR6106622.1 Holliday junction resolvase RecU [Salipaludibacillus agaradhaerens]MCR6118655.1 Holliday junction resolvase RecU [Salipaludibacillus agaradhaerens]